MIDPIEIELTVACPPEHAFDVWTSRTTLWWPPEHTVSADPSVVLTFEPRVGGRIFERTPGGQEHEWGEVLAWEPPRLLRYLWHIRRDRDDATEVEIRFDDDPEGTKVSIAHSGWERLGDRGPRWREVNTMGWDGVLPAFHDACRLRAPTIDGVEGRT
jgi:uncharacterized protein YndB with AHSA1/START domain